jgi:hypothetical protein
MILSQTTELPARADLLNLAPPTWLQRFHKCLTPEPKLPGGFFIKKKPSSKMPESAREV